MLVEGNKLVEIGTGRLYGWVRGSGSTPKQREQSQQSQLKAIKEEIEKNGFYDTEKRD